MAKKAGAGARKMVLVADDEEAVCGLLADYITSLGGKVDTAYDGKRAMEYLAGKDYDFVFLDCNMPEMTGLEVSAYLKGKKPRPKIVMMTGYGHMDKNFAKAVGVDIYLEKPIVLSRIKGIIEDA